jgi:hypothetical protein
MPQRKARATKCCPRLWWFHANDTAIRIWSKNSTISGKFIQRKIHQRKIHLDRPKQWIYNEGVPTHAVIGFQDKVRVYKK